MKCKRCESKKKKNQSKEIIEKMKENDRLFKEKMHTLNEKKKKVAKPNSRSQERERHAHSRTHTHTHDHTHDHINHSKNQKLSVKKGTRFNYIKDKFFTNKQCKVRFFFEKNKQLFR